MAEGHGSQLKPAPAKLKSEVSKYFMFKGSDGKDEFDKTTVVCKLCPQELRFCNDTTNLRNHLSRRHADKLFGFSDSGQQRLDVAFACKLQSDSPRAKKITEAIAMLICKDLRPYNIVENEGFQNLIKVLEPRYVMVTRKCLSEMVIPKKYAEVKTNVESSQQNELPLRVTAGHKGRLTRMSP
ncbi:E3 SUMO-protein ligase ZBED1 [Labeo rohita]|uniref:E3 SUMO-protein ligase ZBED1 n=1 Tax=Labeo rohita TaxID=84645 RepID=A0ABQ8M3D5_LABRO|nr:E3 SUMO-protein ligase ZBED1 [Labeo rohita]